MALNRKAYMAKEAKETPADEAKESAATKAYEMKHGLEMHSTHATVMKIGSHVNSHADHHMRHHAVTGKHHSATTVPGDHYTHFGKLTK